MSPIHAWACFKRRTITRTASHSRLLSLGSCISAAVTVLSRRTTLPSSIFSCRALVSSLRWIVSQVSARIALIVLCSTDFFGLHAHGRRAKAPNEAECSRWKGNSSQLSWRYCFRSGQARRASPPLQRGAVARYLAPRRGAGPLRLGRAGSDAHPATSRPSSARSRSRVGRTDQICWLGQCVLGALSAPAVAGRFGLSNRKSTRHCRSPPAQKRRFHRCSKRLAFVDGN